MSKNICKANKVTQVKRKFNVKVFQLILMEIFSYKMIIKFHNHQKIETSISVTTLQTFISKRCFKYHSGINHFIECVCVHKIVYRMLYSRYYKHICLEVKKKLAKFHVKFIEISVKIDFLNNFTRDIDFNN